MSALSEEEGKSTKSIFPNRPGRVIAGSTMSATKKVNFKSIFFLSYLVDLLLQSKIHFCVPQVHPFLWAIDSPNVNFLHSKYSIILFRLFILILPPFVFSSGKGHQFRRKKSHKEPNLGLSGKQLSLPVHFRPHTKFEFYDGPLHSKFPTMLSSSGPLTLMKLIPVSFATAFASNVFPHPGGPQSRIPWGWADVPMSSKYSGFCIGYFKCKLFFNSLNTRLPRLTISARLWPRSVLPLLPKSHPVPLQIPRALLRVLSWSVPTQNRPYELVFPQYSANFAAVNLEPSTNLMLNHTNVIDDLILSDFLLIPRKFHLSFSALVSIQSILIFRYFALCC